MHKVIKKNCKQVRAWQLGAASEMEKSLRTNRRILLHEDGSYELASLESVQGGRGGEKAHAGDWFKVEEKAGNFYPYPMTATYFNQNYRHIVDDEFEVIPKTLDAWFAEEPPCQEIQFLMRTGALAFNESDSENFFIAQMHWGSTLVAPRSSVVIFYEVKRTPAGEIFAADWNLIADFAFERDYLILDD